MGMIKSAPDVFEMWKADFDAFYQYGRCMVLQVHPQWIGRPARLAMLERLIDHIRERRDVWWATGAEIAEYWAATYPPGQ